MTRIGVWVVMAAGVVAVGCGSGGGQGPADASLVGADAIVDATSLPPAPPQGVTASDGTASDRVTVIWTVVPGATAYRVYRDDEQVAEVSGAMLDDVGATAAPPLASPADLAATQGLHLDRVEVTWTASPGAPGATHAYTVTAVRDELESARSAADGGFRAAPAITGYAIAIDGGPFVARGPVTSFVDIAAPGGAITAAAPIASMGTFITHVHVEPVVTIAPGAPRSYQVRAITAAGDGVASATVSGYRGVGAPDFSWQRSSGDADAGYADLAGATTMAVDDPTAPVNGAARYYRCVVSAAGAIAVTSPGARGYRGVTVAPPPTTIAASDGAFPAAVRVSWSVQPAAASYRVYRDAVLVAEVATTFIDDASVGLAGVPAAPATLTASAGTLTDRVALSWPAASAPAGTVHLYTVTSVNAAGESAPSSPDAGNVGPSPIQHYELSVDGGGFTSVGLVTTTSDTAAPPGSLAVDAVTASAGTLYNRVSLAVTAAGAPGAPRSYAVRAVNAVGSGPPSPSISGFRGVGALGYQWQRSAADADAAYAAISGATGGATSDTAGPTDGSGRYYRCVVSAAGVAPVTSTAVRGWRRPAPSSTPRRDVWVPGSSQSVKAIALANGVVYLGGAFDYLGPPTGAFVAVDRGTGAPDLHRARFTQSIQALAPDGAGGWYVGGSFSYGDDLPQHGLAHIRADGSFDASFDVGIGAGGAVWALAIHDNVLYVAGRFEELGGVPRRHLGAVDLATNTVTAWNPDPDNVVLALAIAGPTLYLGGNFTHVGAVDRQCAAAVDLATGAVTPWQPAANDSVRALVVDGGTVYAGGQFTFIGGLTRRRIAALDAITGAATPWNPDASSDVLALALDGGVLYAGGAFTSIGGQVRNRIAALSTATGAVTSWNPNSDGYVSTLLPSAGLIYVGGGFRTIGGAARTSVAALSVATGAATSWDVKTRNAASALGISGDRVLIGGSMSSVGGVTRRGLAAIDLATGQATAWNPNVTSAVGAEVDALLLSGSTIYAGGSFTAVGGVPRTGLAAIDAGTGAVTPWNPAPSWGANMPTIYALARHGDTIVAGGVYTAIGGQARTHLAALDAGTGAATPWLPNPNGPVRSLVVDGNTLYVGGGFATIAGQPRKMIAAFDADATLAPWIPQTPSLWFGSSYALAPSSSTVYSGGYDSLGAFDRASGALQPWSPLPTGDVYGLAVARDLVYAVGGFDQLGGKFRYFVGAVDATTGLASGWDPGLSSRAWAIVTSGDTVYVGCECYEMARRSGSFAIFEPPPSP